MFGSMCLFIVCTHAYAIRCFNTVPVHVYRAKTFGCNFGLGQVDLLLLIRFSSFAEVVFSARSLTNIGIQ